MSCRRCLTCTIDYPAEPYENFNRCRVCDRVTTFKPEVSHHFDWQKRVGKLVWCAEDGWKPLYGGTTALQRFDSIVESLAGADDFLLECGSYAPPVGQDWGWKSA